ncbi:MAG TPA: NB-ARC domain-containing protein [Terriglobia bacterium]|nr:NB-ARC domain-containing protein [Terriglobia bacterium]
MGVRLAYVLALDIRKYMLLLFVLADGHWVSTVGNSATKGWGALLDRMWDRVERDKQEGDIAYFHALCLQVEYLTKLATLALLACLGDDADRHRYSLEHRLVRADSIGDWVETLNAALSGPAAQFFLPPSQLLVRNLTERVSAADARCAAIRIIQEAATQLGMQVDLGSRAAVRQFFEIGVGIRNRTKGHGATTADQCSRLSPLLAEAAELLVANLELLKIPWAYLHRNISGKYRVIPLLGESSPFDYLRKTRDVKLPNGAYVYLDRPLRVPLVFLNPDLFDILLPNGNYKARSFEVLSYVTNESRREDADAWTDPPGRLPPSHTEGRRVLEPVGNIFSNLPPEIGGYIARPALEQNLLHELRTTDRHPIVSLTGPGGIGKTRLAISVLHSLANLDLPTYDVVLWMSARDVDLLESGPKPVLARVPTQKEIARVAVQLLEPAERSHPDFDPQGYFTLCLSSGTAGPTLFVFDNFETLESPTDAFKWIDTNIRPPNKVLITTRFRDFAGDFPIEIRGMSEDEALALIEQEATRLEISDLLGRQYKEELIRESDGHPYVIKILLGQVAREKRAAKPERIVAGADTLLTALFERTYANLTPASQRVFLLLCSWRVFVPELAVEAVLLRPGNERFDVRGALEELRRFSLVEEVNSIADGMSFVGVPLAATIFGRRKLEASYLKAAIEEDRKLLTEFGAGRREDVQRGVYPRVERLVQAIALKASTNPAALEDFIPVLEYLASKVPKAYLLLAELYLEANHEPTSLERAKAYLRSFLESPELAEKGAIWLRLADLSRASNDSLGEVHALSEAALLPTTEPEEIAEIANRLNKRIRDLKGKRIEEAWSPEIRVLLERVIAAMEKRISDLSATGCSRLAWLLLNVGNDGRARQVAQLGAERDPNNEHCRNLVNRLAN